MKIVETSWPALGESGTMLMTRFLAVSDDEPQLRKEPTGDGAEAPLEGAGSVEFRRGRRSKMRFQSIAAADADAAAWRREREAVGERREGGAAVQRGACGRKRRRGGARRGAAERRVAGWGWMGCWCARFGGAAHEGEHDGAEHSCGVELVVKGPVLAAVRRKSGRRVRSCEYEYSACLPLPAPFCN